MTESRKDKSDALDDAASTHAGSVYYRQTPEPKRRYPVRSAAAGKGATASGKRRNPNLGHAILLSNIRTFTLVLLFMIGLLVLASYIATRSWKAHQARVAAEPRTTRSVSAPAPAPMSGVMVGSPSEGGPVAHVRTELDTEAMRRAIFMQKRAEVLLAAGNHREAIERFQDALDIWPQLTHVWAQLGRVYLEIKDYRRAQIALERAAENDPGNPDTLNDLGVAMLYQNRIDRAMQLFETVNDIDATYASAYFNRALGYLAQNDEENAERALDAFLRIRPNDARALKEKAYLQASRREYQEALDSLRRALSNAPDWPPLYIDAAATAALMGRADEAIRYLDKAEAFTSPSVVYRLFQQPAFREIRLTEAGRIFEQSLAARAREVLEMQEGEDEPIALTYPIHSTERTQP